MKKLFSTAILLAGSFLFSQEVNFNQQTTDLNYQPTNEQSKNSWKLSMGANFRSFDKIKLKQISINSGQFINGSITDIGAGNFLYEVTDPNSQILVDPILNDTITYSTATATARDFEIDGGLAGVILKASSEVCRNDVFVWNMELSLGTAYSKTSNIVNAMMTDVEYDFGLDWNSSLDSNGDSDPGPYPPGATLDGKNEGISGNNSGGVPVAGSITSVKVNYDLNLGLYTIGVGVNGYCQAGPVKVFIGAGPTLSIVDYDLDYYAFSDSYSEKGSYDSTRLRAGAYAEIGMEIPIGERWGIGVSGRYDWVPVDLSTKIAKIELSGFSGNLFLSYQF